jgi:hypothetical protein
VQTQDHHCLLGDGKPSSGPFAAPTILNFMGFFVPLLQSMLDPCDSARQRRLIMYQQKPQLACLPPLS